MAAHYLLDQADSERERERLSLLEKVYDPLATAWISEIGLTAGDKCLEIGFGKGSMLRWLASTICPEGTVVGIDIDPRFVDDIDNPIIEICRGNILEGGLESLGCDLAYARFLFEHLDDPQTGLKNLVSAVRPGGWVFVIATDFSSFQASDSSHENAARFNETWTKQKTILEETNLMDCAFGPKVPGFFRELGLVDIRHDITPFEARITNHLGKEFILGATSIAERNRAMAEGCRTMIDIVSDPSFSFHYMLAHRVMARKRVVSAD